MSLAESPRALNLERRALRLEVGGGMPLFAAALLAVVASLLPSVTLQLGPPSCISITRQVQQLHISNS